MPYQVEPLPGSTALVGEGPHWDPETQSLYYVDVYGRTINRYDYAQNKVYKCKIENEKEEFITFVIPIEGATDKFVVSVGVTLVLLTWNGVSETCIIEKELNTVDQQDTRFRENRFGDGKCDPKGRLFAGTMNDNFYKFRTGNFYKFNENAQHKHLTGNIGLSNGLAWNEKTNKFYFIDSMDLKVREYDYDFNSGEVCMKNSKVVFNLESLQSPDQKILPDGMTIDSEGFIYVATFGGSTIFKVDPKDSKILLKIKLPCEQITSAAFGGPDLDILFVTTGAFMDKPSPAGSTFKITGLGAIGLPMTRYKLHL